MAVEAVNEHTAARRSAGVDEAQSGREVRAELGGRAVGDGHPVVPVGGREAVGHLDRHVHDVRHVVTAQRRVVERELARTCNQIQGDSGLRNIWTGVGSGPPNFI